MLFQCPVHVVLLQCPVHVVLFQCPVHVVLFQCPVHVVLFQCPVHVVLFQCPVHVVLFQCPVHVVLFPIIIMFYLYISTLRNMCAVPSVVVLYTALLSCFSGICSGTSWCIWDVSSCPCYYWYHIYFYTIIIIITKYPAHELESSRKSCLEKVKLNSSVHSCLPQNICYC